MELTASNAKYSTNASSLLTVPCAISSPWWLSSTALIIAVVVALFNVVVALRKSKAVRHTKNESINREMVEKAIKPSSSNTALMNSTLSGVRNLALLVFADFRSKHWSQIFLVVCKFLAVAFGDLCKDIATNNSNEVLVANDRSASSPTKIFRTAARHLRSDPTLCPVFFQFEVVLRLQQIITLRFPPIAVRFKLRVGIRDHPFAVFASSIVVFVVVVVFSVAIVCIHHLTVHIDVLIVIFFIENQNRSRLDESNQRFQNFNLWSHRLTTQTPFCPRGVRVQQVHAIVGPSYG